MGRLGRSRTAVVEARDVAGGVMMVTRGVLSTVYLVGSDGSEGKRRGRFFSLFCWFASASASADSVQRRRKMNPRNGILVGLYMGYFLIVNVKVYWMEGARSRFAMFEEVAGVKLSEVEDGG
jgi:hypothetical protein